MIWRDFFVEADVGAVGLQAGVAAAFGVAPPLVAVVPDVAAMPQPGRYAVVATVQPAGGEYRLMVSVYLFEELGATGDPDDRPILASLATRLGCALLLPAEDPNPFRFVRFTPHGPPHEVYVDADALDETGEVRVMATIDPSV